LECKQWHHTSNLTPIYKAQVDELNAQVESLKAELKAKDKALETIKRTIYNVFPKGNQKQEIENMKTELEQKIKSMIDFETALAKALVELSKNK
jgi:cob(I)alamin adenosyltransferase